MDARLFPYSPDRDVYRLLGISPRADHSEIVAACRRLARALHPDRNRSPRATEEMQVVNAVRSLLTDRLARAEYDAARMRFARQHLSRSSVPPPTPAVATPPAASIAEAQMPRLQHTAWAVLSALVAWFSTLLAGRCRQCQAVLDSGCRYCGECGAPVATALLRAPADWERIRP
jgi:curved DNA-binding protein CbpA